MNSSTEHPPLPELDRERLHSALVELSLERGYQNVSLEDLLEHAGVDQATFERRFADVEACFADYLQKNLQAFLIEIGGAMQGSEGWREQIRAAAYAILVFWRADEGRAQMMLGEVLAAGPRAQLVRDQGMELMFDLIDQGRSLMDDPDMLTRATAEAVGGAILNQMHLALQRGELARGEELVPKLMYTVVLPYLGTEAALEELEMPPPGEP